MLVFVRLMDEREKLHPPFLHLSTDKFSPRENRIHLVRRFDIY